MPAVLRQRNFALLWSGGLISAIGDWMLLVGLPIYIYSLTHSIAATSGSFLAEQIPQILLGSVAGVFVDRWNRKWVIVITNLGLALGLIPLLFIHDASQVWLVYLVAVIESCLSQFLSAESALLPRLVGEEQLVEANTLNTFSSNAARLIGPTVGGLVAALLSLPGVALLDGLSFLLAGLLTACIIIDATPQRTLPAAKNAAASKSKVWSEWLAGLRLIPRERILLGFFIVMALAAFADGLFLVLLAPFVKTMLHGGADTIGYLFSAQAAGGLVGGLFMLRLAKQISPARLIGVCGLVNAAVCLVLFNYTPFIAGVAPAFICFAMLGIVSIGFFVQLTTLLQINTPEAYRGRIFGAYSMVWALFLLLGTLLTGLFGDHTSIIFLLNIQSLLFIPAAIIGLALLRPHAAVSPAAASGQESKQVTASL